MDNVTDYVDDPGFIAHRLVMFVYLADNVLFCLGENINLHECEYVSNLLF